MLRITSQQHSAVAYADWRMHMTIYSMLAENGTGMLYTATQTTKLFCAFYHSVCILDIFYLWPSFSLPAACILFLREKKSGK